MKPKSVLEAEKRERKKKNDDFKRSVLYRTLFVAFGLFVIGMIYSKIFGPIATYNGPPIGITR